MRRTGSAALGQTSCGAKSQAPEIEKDIKHPSSIRDAISTRQPLQSLTWDTVWPAWSAAKNRVASALRAAPGSLIAVGDLDGSRPVCSVPGLMKAGNPTKRKSAMFAIDLNGRGRHGQNEIKTDMTHGSAHHHRKPI